MHTCGEMKGARVRVLVRSAGAGMVGDASRGD